jgi:hypothetical protein
MFSQLRKFQLQRQHTHTNAPQIRNNNSEDGESKSAKEGAEKDIWTEVKRKIQII